MHPNARSGSSIDWASARCSARYPSELSGGQQQRVALARALATDPDVLLLDEPFSALDAPLRRELSAELSQTLRDWGKIAVLVTHDLPEAYQIADMVVLYEHGSTTAAVSKNDLLWNPSSERVARLIGARNILRAAIADASGRFDRARLARRPARGGAFAEPCTARARGRLARVLRAPRIRAADSQEPTGHRRPAADQPVSRRDRRRARRGHDVGAVLPAGAPKAGRARALYDLEIEIPKLVYERLGISTDRHWDVSIHPGSIQVLPGR